ncbi:MAG: type II secretion system protein GspM [Candidatus Xenobia bacterium]
MTNLPRNLLAALAGLVVWVALLIVLLGSVAAAQARARAAQDDWRHLAELVPRYNKLLADQGPPPPQAANLADAVRTAAQQARVKSIEGVSQHGNQVEVKFDKVPGDVAVRFLYNIQTLGLKLAQLQMDDLQQDGIWQMHLVVTPQ